MKPHKYTVKINGQPLEVHEARVSAFPIDQVWPGYQRPIDQSELAAFAYYEMNAPVTVEVIPEQTIDTVTIRPRSFGIEPEVNGNTIIFTMDQPRYITVEVDGYHHALHLFAESPENDIPDPDDPNVIFFGPGEHECEQIRPASGQTIYIAPGAVVYSSIEARNASDLKIIGRGILDGTRIKRTHKWYKDLPADDPEPYGPIALYECTNVEVNGIILRDPNVYNLSTWACDDIRIRNVKIIGSWRYNSDGIDLHNTINSLIERCFIRSFDDSIVFSGYISQRGCRTGHMPCDNIEIRDCVIWNDWGRALEIGAACSAPAFSNIHFHNCDIIRVCHVALDVQNLGRATVENITFENIRIEMDDGLPTPQFQKEPDEKYNLAPDDRYLPRLTTVVVGESMYTQDEEHGQARNILFKDIVCTAPGLPPSHISGYDADHTVEGVVYENVTVNSRRLTDADSASLTIGDHADGIVFK